MRLRSSAATVGVTGAPKGTKGICYDYYFYGIRTGEPDEVSQKVEKAFQQLEDQIAKGLDPIINKGCVPSAVAALGTVQPRRVTLRHSQCSACYAVQPKLSLGGVSTTCPSPMRGGSHD